ncbi:LacI family DNA-binding transcriptional regulator [Pseudonocardia kongjuensis]|uniref:LacI family DNA-binding transcriptional regulator n=1 Tax=Pseudonocardia kongjuensis TaxID=102227 RepID=A0ABP4IY92_9PSEU
MPRRRPTMKDVAEHANVSVSTVSYVLNDSGPVAQERRNRVLDAIRLLDYSPNQSARSLKRRSASTVAMVVPDLTNQFFALVTEGVQRAASSLDVLVVLIVPDGTEAAEEKQAKLLRSQRVDGVIYLSGTGSMPAAIYDLARSGPVVLVDEQIPGRDLPAVTCDSRRGAREVATYVLEQGHRRLAVVGGPPALWTAQQRLAGYREAFAGAGLDPDSVPVHPGDYREDSGAAAVDALLALPEAERPTALLCANDLMAIGAMERLTGHGLSVPHDISVAGFDDLPVSRLLTPKLTSVRQPAHEMGYRAATALFRLLDGASETVDEQLPVTIQIRESVRPPR